MRLSRRGGANAAAGSAPKRIRVMRIAAFSLVAAAVSGAAYVFFFTTVFELREIRLNGGRYMPEDSLSAVLRTHLGSNIYTLPHSALQRELKAFPEVARVTIRRRPLHGLDCYVEERVPVALINLETIFGVDAGGVVLPLRSGPWDVDLPLITGISSDEAKTEKGSRMIQRSMEVLQLLKDFDFSPAELLSEIHVEDADVILVLLDGGTSIQMGTGDYEEKVRKLRTVYGSLRDEESFPGFIDLRFERQVVIR